VYFQKCVNDNTLASRVHFTLHKFYCRSWYRISPFKIYLGWILYENYYIFFGVKTTKLPRYLMAKYFRNLGNSLAFWSIRPKLCKYKYIWSQVLNILTPFLRFFSRSSSWNSTSGGHHGGRSRSESDTISWSFKHFRRNKRNFWSWL